jgi:hypothetical protein
MDNGRKAVGRYVQTLDYLATTLVRRGTAWNGQQARIRILQQCLTAKYGIPVCTAPLLLGRIVDESDQLVRFTEATQRFDTIAVAREDQEGLRLS